MMITFLFSITVIKRYYKMLLINKMIKKVSKRAIRLFSKNNDLKVELILLSNFLTVMKAGFIAGLSHLFRLDLHKAASV